MYFEEIVEIKEADCCEECISFEYTLPCRIDKNIIIKVSEILGHRDKLPDLNKFLKSEGLLQIQQEENLKVELKANSRYLKLCLPSGNLVFKDELENIVMEWISITLGIEIERIKK